jgi:hypothetical protein
MIRRGFWLLTGAVLGVTGYRKASRLTRTLTGQGRPGRSGSVLGPAARAALAARAQPRLTLPGGPVTRPSGGVTRPGAAVTRPGGAATRPGGAARVIAGTASAAGFVRDVRDGMTEYWDLHRGELDRTLGSRSDRTSSGDSLQGRREP